MSDWTLFDEDQWANLNKAHDKEHLKELISDWIDNTGTPMPMKTIYERDAVDDFIKLMEFDEASIVVNDPWYTRYEYKYAMDNVVIKSTNTGLKSSDYFHQENRWLCDSINAPSPYRSWNIKKFRMTLFNALWSLKVKQVDSKSLRSCIAMRKYIASQFRPSAAKAIYTMFGAKNILDFSAGWGDRLSGFLAHGESESYVGVDPNTNLHAGYMGQMFVMGNIPQVEELNQPKQVVMIHDCAESVDYGEYAEFDLIFTSPPYFNIERYTQNDNQSWKKYRKFDDWLSGFLFPSIENAWNHLSVGGHMVINISDVYSGHRINPICDNMNDFIGTLSGANYVGCIGYEMRKRVNSGALKGKTGRFAEPVWIWKKTKN